MITARMIRTIKTIRTIATIRMLKIFRLAQVAGAGPRAVHLRRLWNEVSPVQNYALAENIVLRNSYQRRESRRVGPFVTTNVKDTLKSTANAVHLLPSTHGASMVSRETTSRCMTIPRDHCLFQKLCLLRRPRLMSCVAFSQLVASLPAIT